MNVLVAIPYRHTTPAPFVRGMLAYAAGMTYPQRGVALLPNGGWNDARAYGAHAYARNILIQTCLADCYSHVLWLDVDLINVPADLVERLAQVSVDAAVAPFIQNERIRYDLPAGPGNGGGFFDTGGFVDIHGRHFSEYEPNPPGAMHSVGCCYLVPAWVYRQGAAYNPYGDEVEHISFFRQARGMGLAVLATDSVAVTHAYPPHHDTQWRPL